MGSSGEKSRKMMPGSVPKGSAVRLTPVVPGGTLGIAEGIETALSVSILFNMPCWAAIGASGPGIRRL
jgi:putative DNA primase/helicase